MPIDARDARRDRFRRDDGTQFTGSIGALSFESVATLYADLASLDVSEFQHCVDLAVHKGHRRQRANRWSHLQGGGRVDL